MSEFVQVTDARNGGKTSETETRRLVRIKVMQNFSEKQRDGRSGNYACQSSNEPRPSTGKSIAGQRRSLRRIPHNGAGLQKRPSGTETTCCSAASHTSHGHMLRGDALDKAEDEVLQHCSVQISDEQMELLATSDTTSASVTAQSGRPDSRINRCQWPRSTNPRKISKAYHPGQWSYSPAIPGPLSFSEADTMIESFANLTGKRLQSDHFFLQGQFSASVCSTAVGIMEVSHPTMVLREAVVFKQTASAQINEYIADPTLGVSDLLLRQIAHLATFELFRGTAEAKIHLQAIGQILALRGGVEKLGGEGCVQVCLTYMDVGYAVSHDCDALYTILDEPDMVPVPEEASSSSLERIQVERFWKSNSHFSRFSPLSRSEYPSPVGPVFSEQTVQLSRSMQGLTAQYFLYQKKYSSCTAWRDFIDPREAHTTSVDHACMTQEDRIASILHRTASIYSRSLTQRLRFSHPSNSQDASTVTHSIRHIHLDSLIDTAPFLVLWVLSILAAAGLDFRSKAFMYRSMMQIARVTSYAGFEGARKVMSNFLWIQKWSRREAWASRGAMERDSERREVQRRSLAEQRRRVGEVEMWEKNFPILRAVIDEDAL